MAYGQLGNNQMKKISIIGLGWLGLPLANALVAEGFQVVGSKTTVDGIEAVRRSGIDCYYLNFTPSIECDPDDLAQLMDNTDVLLILLPPSKIGTDAYRMAIQQLVDSALSFNIPRLIFSSSTSVYGNVTGVINEQSEMKPDSDSAIALAEIETWLHQLPHIGVDILRLAGLVGDQRHAGRFLAGKKQVKGAKQGVNIVHQEDVISAILLLIRQDNGGNIYNLCAPQHPTRADFYCQAAHQLQLVPPEFSDDSDSSGKIIDASLICQKLGFEYQYPDPNKMPMSL